MSCHTRSNIGFYNNAISLGIGVDVTVVIPVQIQASTTERVIYANRTVGCHTRSNIGFYNGVQVNLTRHGELSYPFKYRLLQQLEREVRF